MNLTRHSQITYLQLHLSNCISSKASPIYLTEHLSQQHGDTNLNLFLTKLGKSGKRLRLKIKRDPDPGPNRSSLMKWSDSLVNFKHNNFSLRLKLILHLLAVLVWGSCTSHISHHDKNNPHFSVSLSPLSLSKSVINHSIDEGDGAMPCVRPSRQHCPFSSGRSLICFACTGQSSYQGNIIRQSGRRSNEKHSDGQCNGGVLSQCSLSEWRALCINMTNRLLALCSSA